MEKFSAFFYILINFTVNYGKIKEKKKAAKT